MKIKIKNVFIGTIRKCTKYKSYMHNNIHYKKNNGCENIDSISYKENAILVEIAEDVYVDLDILNSFINRIKVKKALNKNVFYLGDLILDTNAHYYGCLFVEKSTLKACNTLDDTIEISAKKLKKTLLLDSRVSSKIKY